MMGTIILKPTEKCNSNCIYCDVVKNKQPLTMSVDLLEDIYRKIGCYLKCLPDERIDIVWHGGEPLLAGLPFYKAALAMQKKYCSDYSQRLSYSIQTNLTLLNQQYIDLFKEFEIGAVGTSFDPMLGIRGPGADRDTAAYNKAFLEGISLLAHNRLGWGFIYVAHKKALSDPIGLFRRLLGLKPDGGFMINPVLIYGEDTNGIAITPNEYSHFLGAIFADWWPSRHRAPNVEPFASMVRNYLNDGLSLTCVNSGDCGSSHLYIGPTGETSQCGRSGDWHLCEYGNIADISLEDLFADQSRKQFTDRFIGLQNDKECGSCRHWKYCHGGCPLDAHAAYGDFSKRTPWCTFYKHFYEEYFEPISGLTTNCIA